MPSPVPLMNNDKLRPSLVLIPKMFISWYFKEKKLLKMFFASEKIDKINGLVKRVV